MSRSKTPRFLPLLVLGLLTAFAAPDACSQQGATIVVRTIQDRRGPIVVYPLNESPPASAAPSDSPLPLGNSVTLAAPEKVSVSGPGASRSFLLFVKDYFEGNKPLFSFHIENDGEAVIDPEGSTDGTAKPFLDVTNGTTLIHKEVTAESARERLNSKFYRLKSPHAVMGIRGTEVGYFVAPEETVAVVYEGVASLFPSPSAMKTDNFQTHEFTRIDGTGRPEVWKLSNEAKLNALAADYPDLPKGNWIFGFTYLPTGPGWLLEDFEQALNPNTAGYDPDARGVKVTKAVAGVIKSNDSGAKQSRNPLLDNTNYYWPRPDLTLHFPPTDIGHYGYLSLDFRLAAHPPRPVKWKKLLVYLGTSGAAGDTPHLVVDLESAGVRSTSSTRWHRLILDLGKYPTEPRPDPFLANVLYLRVVADKDFAPGDLEAEAISFDQIGLSHSLEDLQALHFSVADNPSNAPVPAAIISLPLREHPIGTSETTLTDKLPPSP